MEQGDLVRIVGRDGQSNMRLAEAWLSWLADVRRRSPQTVDRYRQVLRAFDAWLEGQSFLTATRFQMEQFQVRPRQRRGKGTNGAASTQKQEIVVLRGFYGWLHATGVVAENPTVHLFTPTVHNVNPVPIPDDLWHELWTPKTLDAPALLTLGLGGIVGLRRAEIVRVGPRHVQGDMIQSFVRKGGGEHTVPWRSMGEILREGLPHLTKDWRLFEDALRRAACSERVSLVGYTDPTDVNKLLTRITRRRKLPHVYPHMLRHTCATNLLRCGVPVHLVSSLLNHSSLDVTMRYVKAGVDQLAEWRAGR